MLAANNYDNPEHHNPNQSFKATFLQSNKNLNKHIYDVNTATHLHLKPYAIALDQERYTSIENLVYY